MPLLGSDYDSSDEEHHGAEFGEGRRLLASNLIDPAPEVAVDVWSYHPQDVDSETDFQ